MLIPIINVFAPLWAILLVALVILYFFGKKILHLAVVVFLVWLVWYLFHRYL